MDDVIVLLGSLKEVININYDNDGKIAFICKSKQYKDEHWEIFEIVITHLQKQGWLCIIKGWDK